MKCKNCGTEFKEGVFCPECGARTQPGLSSQEQAEMRAKEEQERLAKERIEQDLWRKQFI